MKDILQRLYKIARSYTIKPAKMTEKIFKEKEIPFNTKINKGKAGTDKTQGNRSFNSNVSGKNKYEAIPVQVIDDLALFGLTPPCCIKDLRRARNREIKKYHSDRFMNNPEKLDTAKEIMQIYNTAYDRLKEYYSLNDGLRTP